MSNEKKDRNIALIKDYKEGRKTSWIAKKYNLAVQTVRALIRRYKRVY